jgi:hypothetical protein
LDGRGSFVTSRRNGGENFVGQAEMCEGHKPSDRVAPGVKTGLWNPWVKRGMTR